MDPSTPRQAVSFRPEAYTAADAPGGRPAVASTRPVDIDRRPAHPANSEAQSEMSFADFLDVINPLQHIPLVSDLYRYLTGDQIAGPARIVGGALFGGPIGFVAGLVRAVGAEANGGDLGEFALAALFGDDQPTPAEAAGTGAPAKEETILAQSPSQDRPLPTLQPALAAYQPPAGPALSGGHAPLTGAAALQALQADLRGAGGTAVSPLPIRPALAPNSGYAGIDARYLTPPPRSVFSAQLIEGLDKYKAMSASHSPTLDESL